MYRSLCKNLFLHIERFTLQYNQIKYVIKLLNNRKLLIIKIKICIVKIKILCKL